MHTPGEIIQQPAMWRDTARRASASLDRISALLSRVNTGLGEIIFTGAGTSFYLGQCVEDAVRSGAQSRATSIPVTDLAVRWDDLLSPTRGVLLVSFSRSGGSPESIRVIELALAREGVRNVVITCNPEGELAKKFGKAGGTHFLVLDERTCDKGLAMTSSATSMVVAAQSLAFLARRAEYAAHVEALASAAERLLKVLEVQTLAGPVKPVAEMAQAVDELRNQELSRFMVIGQGGLYGAARECALKIMELSDGTLASLSETPLGARHGPLSFLNENACAFFLLSSDPARRRYETDLFAQVTGKGLCGATVVSGCGLPEDIAKKADLAVDFGAEVADDLRAPLDIVLGQVIAVAISASRGFNVDNPSRRGAISRVVEGAKIYRE